MSKQRAAHYLKTKDKHKSRSLRARYGISLVEFTDMLASQGGVCAICGMTNESHALSVDHDHATGRVRGLLCNACNRGIGLLRDSDSVLEMAAEYVRGPR